MKKLITIVLALSMVLGLSACTVKLSTTDIEPETPPVNVAEEHAPKTYEEMTLEEKMEYKSVLELSVASVPENSYLAPALEKGTGLWGYIDLFGNWVIKPAYKSAAPFVGEYAAVQDGYGDYSYINRSGEVKFSELEKKQLASSSFFSEELMNVKMDMEAPQDTTYMGLDGKVAVGTGNLPLTSGISYQERKYFAVASPFRNGKAVVMRITNAELREAGNTKYSEIAYIIDKQGVMTATFPQGLDVSEKGFDENMRVVVQNAEGNYGLANDSGALVIPCNYLKIQHCQGDLYLVCNKAGFWGFMSKDGAKVIDLVYKDALPFSEGLAAVSTDEGWGFINELGEAVIPFQYDSVEALCTASSEDPEDSGAFSSGIAVVQKGRFWGIIDKTGEILLAAQSSECPVIAVRNGYMSFNYNGACGVFTVGGKYVLLSKFESVGEFR